ncbi:MAG TPA: serine/threonine-protein kinase [Verrucomicrobiae bacterium]|jgi:serine/threonine protein kinase|nr:serine/threonine-protein kinase [Verrucomicrobiae bacterium]
MSETSNRNIEVFTEAMQLSGAERAEYLAQACGGDLPLRKRVEALLLAHERAGDFLEEFPNQAVAEARPKTLVGEKPGDRIGRYRILQQIGEGGCGVVYMAEQEEPVHRRVALKIIKLGMDTKSVIARFEAERQALALMDHPNIAKVFDAGATESGRPYFVMELVRGIKITEYCDKHSMPTKARLSLFMQVCLAVQHAHQKGIIHRDIKPSNILVTQSLEGAALPVVIDFGIAKATTNQRLTDKTIFTAFEMLIGTPAYMSPEQAALTSVDIDTRTDIYSLGVLLYELLTGSTPFDAKRFLKAGLDEIRRIVQEQEPSRPSTRLSTMTAADLTVVAQCRHAESPSLIRAVQGDLDWIVMKSLEKDRTRRYATANALAADIQHFLTGEAISARPPSTIYKFQKIVLRHRLLFSGLGVIALLLIVSLGFVSISLAKERQARREAQIQVAKSQQVTDFLEEMLRGVGPSVARGRDTTIVREILDKTAVTVGRDLTNQPVVEAELRNLIGQVYQKLGEFDESEKMLRAALLLNRRLTGPESEETAASLNELAETLRRKGNLHESESANREALEIRRNLFGPENLKVAASLNNLAYVYRQQHRFTESEALTREALGIRQKLLGKDSLEAADSLRNLSILLADEGKPKESEAMAREVLAIREKVLGTDDPLVASSLDDVAWAAGLNGKLTEAEGLEQNSLALKRKVLGDEHPAVAKSLFLLGQRMKQQGNLPLADAVLGAALSIQRKVLGDQNPDTLYTLRTLSWTFEGEGKWGDAEMADRAALASWRQMIGNDGPQAVTGLEDLVRVLLAQSKLSEAEQALDETLTPAFVRQKASVNLLVQRAEILGRRGRWQEAIADAALVVEYQPTEHYRYHTLAELLAFTTNRPAYKMLCQKILTTFADTKNPYAAERMAKDCLFLPDAGVDLTQVDKLAETSVSLGANDASGMPWFQVAKAMSCFRQGRYAEAMEWAKKPSDCPAHVLAHANAILAMAQWKLGEVEEARASLRKGDGLAPRISAGHEGEDIGGSWMSWLAARISLNEAAAMIQPGSAPEKKSGVNNN